MKRGSGTEIKKNNLIFQYMLGRLSVYTKERLVPLYLPFYCSLPENCVFVLNEQTFAAFGVLTLWAYNRCQREIVNGRETFPYSLATRPISYPESSGSLASGWSSGETLGNWNFI